MKKLLFIALLFSGIVSASNAQDDFNELQERGYLKDFQLKNLRKLSEKCDDGNKNSCITLRDSLKELDTLCGTQLDINAPIEEFGKRNFACPRYLTLLYEFNMNKRAKQVKDVLDDTFLKSLEK